MRSFACLGILALVVCGACTSDDTGDGDDVIDAGTEPDAVTDDVDGNGGGDDDDVDAASTCELGCATPISGSWSVMMPDCEGSTICMIVQTGCGIQLSCTDGAGYSGSVCGNEVNYSGTNADGLFQTCTGTIAGGTMTGSCDIEGTTCNFTSFKSTVGGPSRPPSTWQSHVDSPHSAR